VEPRVCFPHPTLAKGPRARSGAASGLSCVIASPAAAVPCHRWAGICRTAGLVSALGRRGAAMSAERLEPACRIGAAFSVLPCRDTGPRFPSPC